MLINFKYQLGMDCFKSCLNHSWQFGSKLSVKRGEKCIQKFLGAHEATNYLVIWRFTISWKTNSHRKKLFNFFYKFYSGQNISKSRPCVTMPAQLRKAALFSREVTSDSSMICISSWRFLDCIDIFFLRVFICTVNEFALYTWHMSIQK